MKIIFQTPFNEHWWLFCFLSYTCFVELFTSNLCNVDNTTSIDYMSIKHAFLKSLFIKYTLSLYSDVLIIIGISQLFVSHNISPKNLKTITQKPGNGVNLWTSPLHLNRNDRPSTLSNYVCFITSSTATGLVCTRFNKALVKVL